MNKDKLEELKQALKTKKEVEMAKQTLEEGKINVLEELERLRKMNQELETKAAELEESLKLAQEKANEITINISASTRSSIILGSASTGKKKNRPAMPTNRW
jgi:hypothetical protein